MEKNNIRKILLVLIIFIIIGVFPLPYGYYMFLRILTFLGTIILIYNLYKENEQINGHIIALVIILILWNPIIIVFLDRGIWIILDIVAASFLGYLLYYNSK